jgi:hypothetical protein
MPGPGELLSGSSAKKRVGDSTLKATATTYKTYSKEANPLLLAKVGSTDAWALTHPCRDWEEWSEAAGAIFCHQKQHLVTAGADHKNHVTHTHVQCFLCHTHPCMPPSRDSADTLSAHFRPAIPWQLLGTMESQATDTGAAKHIKLYPSGKNSYSFVPSHYMAGTYISSSLGCPIHYPLVSSG